MEILNLPLEVITINGGTQSRVALNESTVAEYAEVIRLGGDLPPVVVFEDGSDIWLADGFHRYHAHRAAGAMEIACDVRTGTKRDAILYSVGANAVHGLRRSDADKRRAVMTLLADPEWAAWPQRQIAQACSVSIGLVSKIVAELVSVHGEQIKPAVRTVERNGTTYQQDTSNIGKREPSEPPPAQQSPGPKSRVTETGAKAPAIPKEKDLQPQAPAPSGAPEALPEVVEIPCDELTALRQENDELRASLKEAIADNEMMGRVFDADDRLKAAMDEAKRQKAIADNAERTLMAKQGEFKARAEQVTYWQRRAEKAEKALAKGGA